MFFSITSLNICMKITKQIIFYSIKVTWFGRGQILVHLQYVSVWLDLIDNKIQNALHQCMIIYFTWFNPEK